MQRLGLKVLKTLPLTLGGAYALYESTRKAYQPSASDYLQASIAVTKGILFPQPPPSEWKNKNRETLELSNPRPEVSGVNRTLHEYGVDLREEELALFLVQNSGVRHSFSPGHDLAAELILSKTFGEEYHTVIERGKNALEAGLGEETIAAVRRQAASAKVGAVAHLAYGAVKSTFSYGAFFEDTLGAGAYNQVAVEESIEHIKSRASDYQAKLNEKTPTSDKAIDSTKNANQSLNKLKNDDSSEEKHQIKPK